MAPLRYRYQTYQFGDLDIHLRTLKNVQQFSDPDDIAKNLGIGSATWALFGVVWVSSEILAQLMLDFDIEGKRILEVGCGIGLASHILNHREADITAMDHHPEAEAFLKINVGLNSGAPIPFVRTTWNDADSSLGEFDLIIGSDVLYEPNHAGLLAAFIEQHAHQTCEVMIIDPDRSAFSGFNKAMAEFGFRVETSRPGLTDHLNRPYKCRLHRYFR